MNNAYIIALHSIDGLGPVRLKKIVDYFKDPKLAWEAKSSELRSLGLPGNVVQILEETRKSLNPDRYLEQILKSGIKILTIFDKDYPFSLSQIYDPPVVFFYKGEFPAKDNALAVVGTRKVTGYGKTVTEQFSQKLAQYFVIVSGLARGVDTIAHKSAISASGKTIAVLGGGINRIFPYENKTLSEQIIAGYGAVISEFPPNYPSLPGNFPSRNRVVAGLSRAVLVTEAAEDSGSLITARLALEQGRDVFAVPGPVTSNLSKGPVDLIKEGARAVFSPEDILEELGVDQQVGESATQQISISELPEIERLVLEFLTEQRHVDEIIRELQRKSFEVSSALIKMEIRGLVKNMGGGNYIKSI